MRWPGVAPEGQTIAQAVMTMDLMPTLLAAAGVRAPAGRTLDGVDLLPVLTGKSPPFPRTLFWRAKRGDRVRKAVREGDLKLVLETDQTGLYDLSADRREERNLLAGAASEAARLRKKLDQWEHEVMAPRLRPFRATPG
jgi:N-acetylgalactosamine-6-sulfatase